MKKILLIPRVKVQNANALSSPFTIGFPAMTAFLGAVHALQRHLNQDSFQNAEFVSAGIVCHSFDLHVYKGPRDYVSSIIGIGKPLNKYGKKQAFIESPTCDLTVSIVIEYKNISADDHEDVKEKITDTLHSKMKLAGGDILNFEEPEFFNIDTDKMLSKLKRKLMRGHVIIERRDLMIKAMQEGCDALTALIDHVKIMHRSEIDEDEKTVWGSTKKEPGWLVPITSGYQGLTELCIAENQRDVDTPHRFAESIVTLGEFIIPYRLKNIDEMLWRYQVVIENNLYICKQNQQ